MRIDLRDRPMTDWTKQHIRDRVLLNGQDVTRSCFMADDVEGVVGVYLRDATGHFYRNRPITKIQTDEPQEWGGAAHEFRKGKVTIVHPAVAVAS